MRELVSVAKALADPTRLRVLRALRERELCVCELWDVLGISQSTLSTHLQMIRKAGLVRTRRVGKWIYYRPDPGKASLTDAIFDFFHDLLDNDANLKRDHERLERRLAERRDGECCRGFDRCVPKRAKRRVAK